jgi:hypothetical protein
MAKIPKMANVLGGHLGRQVAIFVHTFMRMLSFMMQDHQDGQDLQDDQGGVDCGFRISDCGLIGT